MKSDEDERIVISRVLDGGVASRTGVLHPGDIVHEINGNSVQGWSIDQVATYMVNRSPKYLDLFWHLLATQQILSLDLDKIDNSMQAPKRWIDL